MKYTDLIFNTTLCAVVTGVVVSCGVANREPAAPTPKPFTVHGPDEHGVVCYVNFNATSCVKVK
jgi:hypothetical protein